MKYVFPMQFGLHNVFISTVDSRETNQPFKDYTLREQEINRVARQALAQGKRNRDTLTSRQMSLPKRLRGTPMTLIRKLHVRHCRCSYGELLRTYCPVAVGHS